MREMQYGYPCCGIAWFRASGALDRPDISGNLDKGIAICNFGGRKYARKSLPYILK
jgi:hypothetical protein